MAYKDIEDRRRYQREYHARRMLEDPEYAAAFRARKAATKKRQYRTSPAAKEKQKVDSNAWSRTPQGKAYKAKRDAKRKEEGYFSERRKKRLAEGGVELRAKEAEAARVYRANNLEKVRIANRLAHAKKRKERPHIVKDERLKNSHGMSYDEYQKRLELQGGVCFTCKGNNGGRSLVVDHDHTKQKGDPKRNRALLCNGCNIVLGHAKDDPTVLRALAAYLESYK
jgi:hypothetical protein